jgi:hypothetical protein
MNAFTEIRYKCIFYFILLLAMISCSNKKSDETKSLEILLSNFDAKISSEPHIYFLQSNFYCKGCVQEFYSAIGRSLIKDSNSKSKFTLFIKQNEIIPHMINDRLTVIVDSMNLVDIYFPRLANISIVKTKNGNVEFIKTINIED